MAHHNYITTVSQQLPNFSRRKHHSIATITIALQLISRFPLERAEPPNLSPYLSPMGNSFRARLRLQLFLITIPFKFSDAAIGLSDWNSAGGVILDF
jgi:hypothetical protein